MLVPLTLLVAIHLPFPSMIARMCLKRPRHRCMSGECDRTTVAIYRVAATANNLVTLLGLNSPHSCSDLKSSELTPFVRYEQQEDYGAVHGNNIN